MGTKWCSSAADRRGAVGDQVSVPTDSGSNSTFTLGKSSANRRRTSAIICSSGTGTTTVFSETITLTPTSILRATPSRSNTEAFSSCSSSRDSSALTIRYLSNPALSDRETSSANHSRSSASAETTSRSARSPSLAQPADRSGQALPANPHRTRYAHSSSGSDISRSTCVITRRTTDPSAETSASWLGVHPPIVSPPVMSVTTQIEALFRDRDDTPTRGPIRLRSHPGRSLYGKGMYSVRPDVRYDNARRVSPARADHARPAVRLRAGTTSRQAAPPLISVLVPVTYEASSEHRNETTAATSSALP